MVRSDFFIGLIHTLAAHLMSSIALLVDMFDILKTSVFSVSEILVVYQKMFDNNNI